MSVASHTVIDYTSDLAPKAAQRNLLPAPRHLRIAPRGSPLLPRICSGRFPDQSRHRRARSPSVIRRLWHRATWKKTFIDEGNPICICTKSIMKHATFGLTTYRLPAWLVHNAVFQALKEKCKHGWIYGNVRTIAFSGLVCRGLSSAHPFILCPVTSHVTSLGFANVIFIYVWKSNVAWCAAAILHEKNDFAERVSKTGIYLKIYGLRHWRLASRALINHKILFSCDRNQKQILK